MKFNLHMHAWFDMTLVVFGQFGFLHCSIFSMPRIPNNVRKQVIGMLDAGMSTERITRHVGVF